MSGAHFSQLAFLEIGRHPEIAEVRKSDEPLAFADVFAHVRGALAYNSRDRRNDFAVAEIELRAVHLGLHGLYVGLMRLQVGSGNGDLIGSIHICPRQPAARLVKLSPALLHNFLRGFSRRARRIDRRG